VTGEVYRSSEAHFAAAAIILNEEDDASLFLEKRFAPSSMLAPDSPGSRGSGGSNEQEERRFVRAGQSFGSRWNTYLSLERAGLEVESAEELVYVFLCRFVPQMMFHLVFRRSENWPSNQS